MEQTIKERAKMAMGSIDDNCYIHMNKTTEHAYQDGYKDGATEQKRIDIEKADRWLRTHLPRVISNYPYGNKRTDMLNEDMREEFIKAMEQ